MQNDEAQKALSLASVTHRVRAPVLAPLGYLIMSHPAPGPMRSYENYRVDTTDRCCPQAIRNKLDKLHAESKGGSCCG